MRTQADLRELVWEHVDWMRASARRFDDGQISESKRIAVAIRTLVHDTKVSASLLGQLGKLRTMSWLSVAPPSEGGFANPPWIDNPHTPGFSPVREVPAFATDFTTWWEGALLRTTESAITRSWMVLHVANFDGGAHVDPDLPIEYRSISREGGLKPLRINSAGANYPDTSNPIPNGLRTICNEVVLSIETALHPRGAGA